MKTIRFVRYLKFVLHSGGIQTRPPVVLVRLSLNRPYFVYFSQRGVVNQRFCNNNVIFSKPQHIYIALQQNCYLWNVLHKILRPTTEKTSNVRQMQPPWRNDINNYQLSSLFVQQPKDNKRRSPKNQSLVAFSRRSEHIRPVVLTFLFCTLLHYFAWIVAAVDRFFFHQSKGSNKRIYYIIFECTKNYLNKYVTKSQISATAATRALPSCRGWLPSCSWSSLGNLTWKQNRILIIFENPMFFCIFRMQNKRMVEFAALEAE